MKKITSVNNDLIKETVKLKQKKYIVSHGQFLVEGKNIIEEAIKSNIVKTIFVSNTNLFKEFSNRIEVTEEIISKLSSNESNIGAIALCENVDIDFNIDSFNKIVVLDKISNPGNFGSIIRTAKALGYDAVITMGESVYKWNSKVISGTQGAIFNFPVIQFDEYKILEKHKPYFFMVNDQSENIENVSITEDKFALVFGNEATGISDEIRQWKGKELYINIDGVESLSVANAAAIGMYKYK